MPVGVGGSCKGVPPGASGASEAELLGGLLGAGGVCPGVGGDCPGVAADCPGVGGDCPGVAADCPGVCGDCPGVVGDVPGVGVDCPGVVGAGLAAFVGLPGSVPGPGEAVGEGPTLPACVAGLGLGPVGPEAGDPVGDAEDTVGDGVALLPVGGDASGTGDGLVPVGVDRNGPVGVAGDAPELVG